MKLNWTDQTTAKVRKLRDLLLRRSEPQPDVRVAGLTNGLPVYSDLSGTLLLDPSGRIRFFDFDREQTSDVVDAHHIALAGVAAVELYPDLIDLLPGRPATAGVCPDCSGAGKLFDGKVYCGSCSGLGWLMPDEGPE